jgi:hypothetical protein
LRQQIADRLGVDTSAVMLHATHTHGAPITSTLFSPTIGRPDATYIHAVAGSIAAAASVAAGRMLPVEARRGTATSDIAINRRRISDDGRVGGPDPHGLIDREVVTVRYVGRDDSTVALLVHFTCHPSSCSDRLVSADYPGAMRDVLHERLGSTVTIGFLQGCSGDIRVNLVEDGEFRTGTTDDVVALGTRVANGVAAAIARESRVEAGPIRVWESTTPLELSPPSRDELLEMAGGSDIWAEWSSTLLAGPQPIQREIPVLLHLLQLGDGLAILGFDAEVSVAYGLHVKRVAPGVLPVGYANGMIGYVVTEQQLREGGYEPALSYAYTYRTGPFAPSVERTMLGAIDAILGRLTTRA